MARIRSIKPEFWDDEKLAQLPRDVRLLYIGMWTFSDDWGVIKANPVWLKSKIFGYDEIQLAQFKKWLEMLERPGFSSPGGTVSWAVRFEANGEAFYYLPKFSRHQRVDHPSILTRNPEPPKEILEAWTPVSRDPREGSRDSRAVLDGKGEEGKGEDPPLTPPPGEKAERKRFVKPTLEQVAAYCLERKNGIDPQAWMDHYERCGWVVGRNRTPMKDWQAAVRTWENNRKGGGQSEGGGHGGGRKKVQVG